MTNRFLEGDTDHSSDTDYNIFKKFNGHIY